MVRWDRFVDAHPDGTPFHLSCWLRTIVETYAFKPLLYVAEGDEGELQGVLPSFSIRSVFTGRRLISLPFSDFGGPLCVDESVEECLLASVVEMHNSRVKYIEMRGPLAGNHGFACRDFYQRHVLDLSLKPEKLLRFIDRRTIQYSIRKADRMGVTLEDGNDERGLREFYRLNQLTRKKHGVPSQPLRFFERMFEHMVAGGKCNVILALKGSQVIASGVFFLHRETVYYKYNASDPSFLSQATPNHLLTWQAIRRASAEGYRSFDFGRTAPTNEGLMRYKALWGSKSSALPYHYYPAVAGAASKEGDSAAYRTITKIWRHMPDSVAGFIGPMVIRHMA
jgi:FemAB-related protein (PEP-CTERM system-associated)